MNKDKLNGLYNIAIKEQKDGDFLYSLYSYLDFLLADTELLNYADSILKQSREGDGGLEIENLRTQLVKESKEKIAEFEKFFRKNGMEASEAMKEIGKFRSLENGSMIMSGDLADNLIDEVRITLARIQNGTPGETLVKKYGVYDSDGILVRWNWTDNLGKYEEKKRKYERLAPTKLWYWWDQIYYFYTVFKNYEEHWKDNVDKHQWFVSAGLTDALREIEEIIKGRKTLHDKLYFIHPGNLRGCLEKFHFHFISEIESKTPPSPLKSTFDKVNGVLTVGVGGTYVATKFRKDLLKILFSRPNVAWSFDVIAEKSEGAYIDLDKDSRKKLQTKVYEACRGINNHLATKCGTSGFLLVKDRTVKINPKYL